MLVQSKGIPTNTYFKACVRMVEQVDELFNEYQTGFTAAAFRWLLGS